LLTERRLPLQRFARTFTRAPEGASTMSDEKSPYEELVRRRQEQETIAEIQQEILSKAFERDAVFQLILERG